MFFAGMLLSAVAGIRDGGYEWVGYGLAVVVICADQLCEAIKKR